MRGQDHKAHEVTLPRPLFGAAVAVLVGVLGLLAAFPAHASVAPVMPMQNQASTLAPQPDATAWPQIELTLVSDRFQFPAHAITAPGDADRFFLVERAGQILVRAGGEWQDTPFLDIRDRVDASQECGLLSMAFPPDFGAEDPTENPIFYVYYSANTDRIQPPAESAEPNTGCDTVIARFTVTDNPNVADPASEEVILLVNQPYANHNGGQIAFGPDDMLYIGLGDGGSGGDPLNAGQRVNTLLGKMLRIQVGDVPTYTIPIDNPFAQAADILPEIWATGLRNPYRFSFDRATGDLYIGDVGQNSWEEINRQPASSPGGENYGWRVVEGIECYSTSDCPIETYTPPIYAYPHLDEGCSGSVTGGYVYRGGNPALTGIYIFGDYCTSILRGLRPTENQAASADSDQAPTEWENAVLLETGIRILSFAEDAAGELYLLGLEGSGGGRRGVLYRIDTSPEIQLYLPELSAAQP